MDVQPKRFADFAGDDAICMDGVKTKIQDIINSEILITAYKIRNSRYSKSNSENCLMLQFKRDDKKYVVFTGSSILVEQIEKYKEQIPFLTIIRRIDKYYTFS
jgi:uncharacterized protein with WD repeat